MGQTNAITLCKSADCRLVERAPPYSVIFNMVVQGQQQHNTTTKFIQISVLVLEIIVKHTDGHKVFFNKKFQIKFE